MPPKKKAEAPAEKPIIGRFKSNLKVGRLLREKERARERERERERENKQQA